MKIIIILLIPFYLLATNTAYQDTLFLKKGEIIPCLVKAVNENAIKVEYGDQVNSGTAIKKLKNIYIWDLGIIFTDSIGFRINLDSLNSYVSFRNEEVISQQILEKEKIVEEEKGVIEIQEIDTTSFYPILGFRYGYSNLISSSKFLSAYNNPDAFVRPLYQTTSKWPKFEPFKSNQTFSIDFGVLIQNTINIGISYEYFSINEKDDFFYEGLIGYDQFNNPIFFDIDETYNFETKITPVQLFFNYRILKNFLIALTNPDFKLVKVSF